MIRKKKKQCVYFHLLDILILYILIKYSTDEMRETINGTVFAFTLWMELFLAGIAEYAQNFSNLFPLK